MKTRPPLYRIENELSAEIVDREIAVLQGMSELTTKDLNVDPTKFTHSEIQEIIRVNTKNIVLHQEWLDLIRRVVPEDIDSKLLLLRSLHQHRLFENLTIIAGLQLQPGTLN